MLATSLLIAEALATALSSGREEGEKEQDSGRGKGNKEGCRLLTTVHLEPLRTKETATQRPSMLFSEKHHLSLCSPPLPHSGYCQSGGNKEGQIALDIVSYTYFQQVTISIK